MKDRPRSSQANKFRGKPQSRQPWLVGGGELGGLIREHNWAATPLGPIQQWPQSLRTAVNLMLNSQHPMWIGWGPEMIFLYNDAYVSVLSRAKHPWALGRPASEVWAEIWDICGPLAEKVLQKGDASFVDDVRLFMSRGDFLEETYYSFSYSAIHDEAGKVAGLFCPSTETTQKVLHARRLHTLSELSGKALLEKTTESACASSMATLAGNPDDIPFSLLYLLTKDGKAVRLQGSTQIDLSRCDVAPAEILLDGRTTFWPVERTLKKAQAKVVSVAGIASLPSGAAGQRVTEAIVLPLTSAGKDRPFGVLIAGVNPARKLATEHKTFFNLAADQVTTAIQNARAIEAEKKQAEALAEIDRAKTEFFSNVSHEFRTPLTLMLGPLEDTLAQAGQLSPQDRERLEVAHRNSIRLLKLVNTLLDFSRLEAGRMQASYEPCDLSRLTSELASVFRSAIERGGLQFTVDCPPLPEPVFVDRDMWEKIVFNLLSNALKFTLSGKIRVALHQTGSSVELTVSDTGTGIPGAELPHLFERFHRVKDARGRTFEGSGIGLALVQELVKLHGGKVRVESELDRGSTFTISLPLGSAHLPVARIRASQGASDLHQMGYLQEALRWLPGGEGIVTNVDQRLPVDHDTGSSAADVTRPRILLADDNADMREYVRRLLAPRFEVEAVADGESALAAARKNPPDLLLSDVMMPKLDGFGLLQALRASENTAAVPVILLSARAGEESRVEGIGAGADDYLVKPFSARELVARVQTHLALARQRREAETRSRESHSLLRAAMDAGHLGAWDWDIRSGRVTWTDRIYEFHGVQPGQFEGTVDGFIKLVHPEDLQSVRAAIGDTLAGNAPYELEFRAIRPSGETRWLSTRAEVFRDGHGTPVRMVGITQDVTSRKQAEVALASGMRQQGALYKLADQLQRATVLGDAYAAAFDAIFSALRCDRASILLYDDKNVMHFVSWSGLSDAYREATSGHSPWSPDEKQPVPICMGDVQTAEMDEQLRSIVLAEGIRALAFIPLVANGKLIGKFMMYFDQQHSFTHDEVELGLAIARQLAFSVDRRRADEALRNSEERFRSLAERLDVEVRARTLELERRNVDIERQSEQLRGLSRRLLQIQDDERRRIARELHDSAGQTLTALGLNLAHISRQVAAATPRLQKDMDQAMHLVQQLSQEVRTMSYLLHPPLLEESGLLPSLEWYIRGLEERSSMRIQLSIPETFGRLPREMELAVFRVVQESLTNIHRHSGSRTARIRIAQSGDQVTVEVQDEGRGIPPERLAQIQSHGSGVGIGGMRERVRQFSGEMHIESTSGGTTIRFIFPVRNEPAIRDSGGMHSLEAAG
jgi:PAS domain S-box-containing protein